MFVNNFTVFELSRNAKSQFYKNNLLNKPQLFFFGGIFLQICMTHEEIIVAIKYNSKTDLR